MGRSKKSQCVNAPPPARKVPYADAVEYSEENLCLIVYKYPALYKPTHSHFYSDKTALWGHVAKKFKEEHVTGLFCQENFTRLRDNRRQKERRETSKKKSGSAGGKQLQAPNDPLWYLDAVDDIPGTRESSIILATPAVNDTTIEDCCQQVADAHKKRVAEAALRPPPPPPQTTLDVGDAGGHNPLVLTPRGDDNDGGHNHSPLDEVLPSPGRRTGVTVRRRRGSLSDGDRGVVQEDNDEEQGPRDGAGVEGADIDDATEREARQTVGVGDGGSSPHNRAGRAASVQRTPQLELPRSRQPRQYGRRRGHRCNESPQHIDGSEIEDNAGLDQSQHSPARRPVRAEARARDRQHDENEARTTARQRLAQALEERRRADREVARQRQQMVEVEREEREAREAQNRQVLAQQGQPGPGEDTAEVRLLQQLVNANPMDGCDAFGKTVADFLRPFSMERRSAAMADVLAILNEYLRDIRHRGNAYGN
ncbi:Methionine--tRNA ligase, partial [Frankliniella fusca]